MGKFLLGIAAFVLLVFLIIWLWQRQPIESQSITKPSPQAESSKSSQDNLASSLPQNNLVSSSDTLRIKGKLAPQSYLAISSNSISEIIKASESGNFELEIKLAEGLNLIDYVQIPTELNSLQHTSLTYYYSKGKKFESVFAGPVKSLFDNLLTLTLGEGSINIRTSKSTELDIPQNEEDSEIEESTSTALRNIRVGDYAISLGEKSDQDTQISNRLEILRGNAPQNNSKVAIAQVVISPKQNVFSAKNTSDSKVVEFTLDKNSEVVSSAQSSSSPSPKTSPTSQITKDKNAIIIYQEDDDENLVKLIYLI